MKTIFEQPLIAIERGESVGAPTKVQLRAGRILWDRVLRQRLQPILHSAKSALEQNRTPMLIFSRQIVEDRMRRLATLGRGHGVHFLLAVKSLPLPELLNTASLWLSGFDVSNATEYARLPQLSRSHRVFVTSPAFDTFELPDADVCWVVDSVEQWRQCRRQAPGAIFAVRMNTADLLAGEGPQDPAYYPQSRFGFLADELRALAQEPDFVRNPPRGLHLHHGSERNEPSTIAALARAAWNVTKNLGLKVEFINLGGGLHRLGFEDLEKLFPLLRQTIPGSVALYFEPGRFLSTHAGYALARVKSTWTRDGILHCTLDLSSECHLRWSRPALLTPVPSDDNPAALRVRFFGPTCYEADYIGSFTVPGACAADFRQGIEVLFANVAGYSMAWNTGFNGVAPASVQLVG